MKSLGTKWEKNNKVIPCSEKVEAGYFFGRGGGRIRYSGEVKPRPNL